MLSRKQFLSQSAFAGAGFLLLPGFARRENRVLMTVSGPVPATQLGFTLSHEHILVDFIGAEQAGKHRYNPGEVYAIALPFLKEIKAQGVNSFIDCTPAYLGRDVLLLKRLSAASGLNILATTGYYGAAKEKYLPQHAYTETARQLADRWIDEYKNGIDGTGIRPGLIKTGTDKAPLTAVQRKLIEAAGLTHLSTGLVIAVHTGNGEAAFEQLDILKTIGVPASARIWVHAQSEANKDYHIKTAKLKSWVSFDGVNPDNLQIYLDYLKNMKAHDLLGRVLISQDSGWYHVGETNGGDFKPFTCIRAKFVPLLLKNGFTEKEIDVIFNKNPAEAFAIRR